MIDLTEHIESAPPAPPSLRALTAWLRPALRLLLPVVIALSCQRGAQATPLQGMVEFTGATGKIGVQVSLSGKVTRVHPQSPAAQSGLVPGDKVIKVDGKEGDLDHIHGTPGTTVTLTVQRGEARFVFEIERVNQEVIAPYAREIASGGSL